MLVMMLRTVTTAAPCLWCSSCTTVSAVVPCAVEMLVQPGQRRRDPADPDRAAGGRAGRRMPPAGRLPSQLCEHHRRRFGGMSADAQQPVGETRPPPGARHCCRMISSASASEVFDQHDPQRDGDRPQFADRQRLHLLVGAHEPAQQLGIEVAVGVCDEGPRHAEHPRISRERTVDQLRQLPIVARRQCRADLADLPLDEVVIIDQPLSRRRNSAACIERFGDHAIGVEQDSAIFGEPAGQWMTLGRPRRDCLRSRQASCVLFEAFGAEQLFTNGS